jgi:hypothetical protein
VIRVSIMDPRPYPQSATQGGKSNSSECSSDSSGPILANDRTLSLAPDSPDMRPAATQGGESDSSEPSTDSTWPILINDRTPDPPMQPVTSRSRYRSSTVQNHSKHSSSPSQSESPVPRLSRCSHRLQHAGTDVSHYALWMCSTT